MKSCYFVLGAVLAAVAPIQAQEAQGRFERSLNVAGPLDLDASTDSGGIIILAGSPGVVTVRATLKAHRGMLFNGDVQERIRRIEQNPPIEQSGNRIRIGHITEKGLLRGISMRLEIQAPADARVRAQADSGGVRVEGFKGPVECSTDSGGIEVTRIGSEVRATADSGGIRIREIQGSVYARADSGGIEAVGVAGPVDVQTDSGGIRIEQTKAASIRAQADSGGANLRLAPNGGYDLALSSDSGRVSTPTLDPGASVSKNKANGKLRGGGPLVDVNVDSGQIVVNY